MKSKIIFSIFIILIFCTLSGHQDTNNFRKLKGPYLGQKVPGMVPEIFAPGIISLPESNEWSSAFSPDGREFYFYRISLTPEKTELKIYQTLIKNEEWSAPREVKFARGFNSSQPHVMHDNKTLYFAWHRPVPDGEKSYMGDVGIWAVTRTPDGWSVPFYTGQGMFVSSDNEGNIFTTDMSSRNIDGKTYLAQVELKNGKFAGFKRLAIAPEFDSPAHPCIAPDGSFIVFDVAGGSHMYLSFKKNDGSWAEAIDLAEHGFDIKSGGATITPDGKYLFFHLNGDLWWVDIKVIKDLKPNE